jgi:hypothetical protein
MARCGLLFNPLFIEKQTITEEPQLHIHLYRQIETKNN